MSKFVKNTTNYNKRGCGSDEPWGYFTDDHISSSDNYTYERNASKDFKLTNSFSPEFHCNFLNQNENRNKMRKTGSGLNMYPDRQNYSSGNISGSSDDGNNTCFSDASSTSRLTSSSSSSSSNKSSLSSIPSSLSATQSDNKDKVILCRMDNILSNTSCRSFSDLSTTGYGHWEDVTIALKGFLLVQTSSRGEEVEFCVILTTNENEFCCWKPYSCFEEIAEACKAVNLNMKEKMSSEQNIGHELTDLEWHNMTTDKNTFYRHREFDILLSYIYDSFDLGNKKKIRMNHHSVEH